MDQWRPRIEAFVREKPTATEDDVAWAAVERLSADAAALLGPAFAQHNGRNGRLSVQTDPRFYRDPQAMVRQAERFDRIAPNILVKIPATSAGLAAIEAATAEGISINATVCFTLSQCVAVAEAVERGLRTAQAVGHDISTMGPVCTIMVGRLDDWLKVVMDKDGIITDPGHLEWAGVAVFKKTYRLFQDRGYRARLLVRGVSQPHALERAHRRRCRDLAAVGRGRSALWPVTFKWCRASTRPSIRRSWTTCIDVSPIFAARTTSWGCRSPSSIATRPRDARCGSFSAPATTSAR